MGSKKKKTKQLNSGKPEKKKAAKPEKAAAKKDKAAEKQDEKEIKLAEKLEKNAVKKEKAAEKEAAKEKKQAEKYAIKEKKLAQKRVAKSERKAEKQEKQARRERVKRPPIWPYLLTTAIVAMLALAIILVMKYCKVTTIYVDGNVHYTDDQIADMIMDGRLGDNSIYLFLKYRNREIKDVPFIETMSVSIESADTIRITVYEKSLAGYVEYLDRYLYFDRDGTVVESSQEATDGIPLVTGIAFDHAILYEPLPVENTEIFSKVLDITQLMNKYDLDVDRIHFDSNSQLVLYFNDIQVEIGDEEFIDEKVQVLPDILSKLTGKSGVIDLTDYESGDTITFESNETDTLQ